MFIRQWKKPGVYLRTEDIRGMSINQRRHFDGLPPLNTQELAELDELNKEVCENLKIIGNHKVAAWFYTTAIIKKISRPV